MADLNELNIKITAEAEKAAKKFEELADSMSKVKDTINKIDFSKLKSGFKSLNDSLAGKALKGAVAAISLKAIGKAAVKATSDAVTFTQTINSMNVIMGEGAKEAQDFAYKLQDAIMLDPSATMSMQNSLYSVIKGFGNTSVAAQNMSKNLTQLSYDLSIARYDILGGNAEEAANRLRMALAGTIEPLQRMGFAIKEADLKMVAAKHGYDVNIRNLDSATKAQLRYMAIMEQSSKMQGYYAQNINTPAVALANLKNSVHQISVEIGKTFIPILNATLPYIRAVVKGILTMIKTFNSLIGIKTEDLVNTKTLGSASNELEQIGDNAEQAGKKLKKSFMLGIDELNVLDNSASSAADSLDTTHIDFDLSGYDYDMLEGLDQEKLQEIEDKLAPLQPLFDGIAQAAAGFVNALKEFAGGPLYDFLVSVGDWMADHPETMEKLGEGLFYVAAGLIALKAIKSLANVLGIPALVKGLGDAWTKLNGVYGVTYAMDGKTWTGWSLLADKILKIAAVAAILYGIFMIIDGVIDLITGTGDKWENIKDIISGVVLVVTGLAIAFGVVAGWPAVIAVAIAGLFIYIIQNFEKVTGSIAALFIDIGVFLADVFDSVAEWFQKVADYIWTGIGNIFIGLTVKIPVALASITPKVKKWFLEMLKKLTDALDKTAIGQWINEKFNISEGLDSSIAKAQKEIDDLQLIWDSATDVQEQNTQDMYTRNKEREDFWQNRKDERAISASNTINDIAQWIEDAEKRKEEDKKSEEEDGNTLEQILGLLQKKDSKDDKANSEIEQNNEDINNALSNLEVPDVSTILANQDESLINQAIADQNQLDFNASSLANDQSLIDETKLFKSSQETATKDINTLITSIGDRIIYALAKVQEACENIKINVENNYYGGGDGYATGGYPTSGEYFFAREDGLPEMVGRVGNKTAVMNNGQVADTMAQSLVRAMSQSGASSNEPTIIENKLYLDGEVVYNNQQKIQRSKGYSLGLGVFANV